MNTLDELLTAVPGLRKIRSLNAEWLRTLLDRQRGQCTWCGDAVPKPRRDWCSDECVVAFKLRCDSNYVANYVTKRDLGMCCLCRRDTHEAERRATAERLTVYLYRQRDESPEAYQARKGDQELRLLACGYARGRFREVDHEVPVVHGGGLCDVAALRLLCGACHQGLTADLAANRAGKKRKTKKARVAT